MARMTRATLLLALLWGRAAQAAPETCNGVDDDGDGAVDEAPVAFFADDDVDGSGDPAAIVWAVNCTSTPVGTVTNDGDCDDDRPESRPGLAESTTADGFDDDCDGTIDENAFPAVASCSNYQRLTDEDSAFLACNHRRSWAAARAECALHGYHLVTIDDEVENDDLLDWLPPGDLLTNGYWWIGLHEENVQNNWVWETGPATLLLWNSSQPDDFGLDCGMINNLGLFGLVGWFDETCAAAYPYVCEADCIRREAFLDADGDGLGAPGTALLSCTLPTSYVWNDQDCDDTADSVGMLLWYVDDDGDGFGSEAIAGFDCEPLPDSALNAQDCDDTSALIHPDSVERCDAQQLDEDCDGAADDLDPDVDPDSMVDFYVDADGDGYGSEVVVRACDLDEGLAAVSGDCSDTDFDRFPGQVEVPGDGVDQDCDGLDAQLDEPDEPGEPEDKGKPDVLDEDGDGFSALEDCDDQDPDTHPGAPEDLSPLDRDCDGLSDPTGAFSPACGCAQGRTAPPVLWVGAWLGVGLALALRRR